MRNEEIKTPLVKFKENTTITKNGIKTSYFLYNKHIKLASKE